MTRPLSLLLSTLFDGCHHPDHLHDLYRSGLSDATIRAQKIRTVPPAMIRPLLGFDPDAIVSAYLIPFADPRGGWMDHVRVKVFPSFTDARGQTVKYLQPKRSGVRIFFPIATLGAVRHAADPIYIVEGEKKSLAVAQTGLPAVGICGIEGWHLGGASALHPDLDDVGLSGRVVNVVPDSDYRTNPAVERGVRALVAACRSRGAASVPVVLVPADCKGIDDYLVRP